MTRRPKKPQAERDIDENLRRVYQRVVEEEVPDRFTHLLEQLRQQEQDQDPEPEA